MSNILKFFVKRILIVYVVLIIACFLSKNQKIPMIFALSASTFVSFLRLASFGRILKLLTSGEGKNRLIIINLLLYMLYLIAIGVVIAVSLKIGTRTFLAALTGTLLIVIIIMINAITEALGITRNQFGQKVK